MSARRTSAARPPSTRRTPASTHTAANKHTPSRGQPPADEHIPLAGHTPTQHTPAQPGGVVPPAVLARALTAPQPYDFAGTLAPLWLGPADPTARLSNTDLWWAARTPEGPGTLHLHHTPTDGNPAGTLIATGYGAGAGWLVEHCADIAGLTDDVTGFAELIAEHPVLRRAWRRHRGLRLTRTRLLVRQLPAVILAQKVTYTEAIRGYAKLVRRFGEPAPGPLDGLLLPPDPTVLATTPAWALHPLGIEAKRADALRMAASRARRLATATDSVTATAWLTALPGIGPWTAAECVRVAFGDPDAVTVGDYHVPHQVAYALTGAVRAGARTPSAEAPHGTRSRADQPSPTDQLSPADQPSPTSQLSPADQPSPTDQLSPADQRMLALLAPYAGQRARVVQVLFAAHPAPPRLAPRAPLRSFAHF